MPLENLKNKKIYLASASPRRKELLTNIDIKFEIISGKETDETIPENLTGKEAVLFLSEKKAKTYIEDIKEGEILITADTVVYTNKKILGKPKNENEAIKMLKTLSGKKHKVITGVTIYSQNKKITFSETTSVKFKSLTDNEISYYVKKYKPFDKAGSYGIQEWIGYIGITGIKGSYFNVMGLPVQKIYETLKEF